jgi:Predicted membrane protein
MADTSMSSTDLAGPNSVEVVKTPALADPLPIGAAGFALTTFTLSLYNAGIPHAKGFGVVLPIALFYGGIAQFMAGMWEIRRNNMFGAMVFTSFGAFWMSFAAYVHFIVPTLPPAIGGQVTGIFLVMWSGSDLLSDHTNLQAQRSIAGDLPCLGCHRHLAGHRKLRCQHLSYKGRWLFRYADRCPSLVLIGSNFDQLCIRTNGSTALPFQ